jgi:hypothetical protein
MPRIVYGSVWEFVDVYYLYDEIEETMRTYGAVVDLCPAVVDSVDWEEGVECVDDEAKVFRVSRKNDHGVDEYLADELYG